MAGNVWEWCRNAFDYADDAGLLENPNRRRVLRGGSWRDDPGDVRSVFRFKGSPGDRDHTIGFRVVCSSPIKEH